jgi:cell division transport system permease protein
MNAGAWFERHAQVLVGAVGRLLKRPIASLMIITVIGVALALPLLLQLLIQNARGLSGEWAQSVELSVYLKPDVDEAAARALAAQLRGHAGIASVQLITAAQAFEEFKATSGFGSALDLLDSNPLPHVIIVRPSIEAGGAQELEALRVQVAAIAGVDQVQLDTAWVKRLHAMLDLLGNLVRFTAALLIAGILIIVSTVTAQEVANRRGEIEVMKLVGGTDGFARRPFLYTGVLYGLGGGLLALLLVGLAHRLLQGAVRELAATYGSAAGLTGMEWKQALVVLAGSSALGWLGAWAAATWHIRGIDPT